MSNEIKDLIIVGAGPAGLSASIYASRYGVKNMVIGEVFGGLTTETHEIGNWLGEKAIAGYEFAQKAEEHVKSLGAELNYGRVERIEKKDNGFKLETLDGKIFEARAVIMALGTRHRHLDIPGEKELAGKGVSYCATCDGFFYKDKIAAVIGGNNSAAGAAIHLGKVAKKVYIIYRRESLRAENYWLEAIKANDKIEIINNVNVLEILGESKVEKVRLDKPWNDSYELGLDGVFIEIGLDPNTQLAQALGVEIDKDNYIKVDKNQATNLEGLYAAGDITDGSNKFQQIVTAASEGAIAAESVAKYLKSV